MMDHVFAAKLLKKLPQYLCCILFFRFCNLKALNISIRNVKSKRRACQSARPSFAL